MNSATKGFSIGRALMLVLLVFISIFSIGAFIYFQSITLISPWIPILCALSIAAFSGTVCWRVWSGLTGIGSFLPNFISHLLFFTIIITSAFYIINYATLSSPVKERAEFIEKVREQHYRSQRVGKNRYVKGAPYYEYYMRIRIGDDRERKIQIPFKVYQRLGHTDNPEVSSKEITVCIRKGAFGAKVISLDSFLKDNPKLTLPKKEKRRCRFFGTGS